MVTNRETINVPFFKTVHFFLLLLLLFGMGGWFFIDFFYKMEFESLEQALKTQEVNTLKFQRIEIEDILTDIVKDLLFLAMQNELKAYFNSEDQEWLDAIEREYKQFSMRKKKYDQIRYLDNSGQEIVRINYNAGNPTAVAKEKLQNKSKRYYFSDTFRLKKDEVFISPLDLNIEHGDIERPLKPMLRIGTPVFDATGNKKGIVLINYFAQELLDALRINSNISKGNPMLLNQNGFWLLHSDPEKEWGFMLKERQDANFVSVYPEAWQAMLSQKTGQFLTEKGLFTFSTIYPLQEGFYASTGSRDAVRPSAASLNASQYFWVLISYIPPHVFNAHLKSFQFKFLMWGGGLFLIGALAAWLMAFSIVKRRIYEDTLLSMALYDDLTSLPNRKYFWDKLDEGISHARRYGNKLGLLYIDLDGFKAVNDKLGHESGDELLVEISQRMLNFTRETDTVARVGGDEFAIILFQVDSVAGLLTVGEKLIQKINEPVKIRRKTATVGASVGATIYPGSAKDREKLVNLADKAMYTAKSKGKNTCFHV
ncbi:MAG: GGDEF domain-containing protein [Desulfobacterales bacterium]|nr:MAG: GGDEF domain-containing protein [Desulfobacterales bacterium]